MNQLKEQRKISTQQTFTCSKQVLYKNVGKMFTVNKRGIGTKAIDIFNIFSTVAIDDFEHMSACFVN